MFKPLSTLMLMLAIGSVAGAASLLNYETRVVRAAEQIERIKADADYSEEGVDYIKRLLPQSERVELAGREVTVDNSWLHKLLESYSSQSDQQQSLATLNETLGRLRALDDHLRRAQGGVNSETNPRDKVREILSRPAYHPPEETAAGTFIKSIFRKVRAFKDELLAGFRRLIEKLLGAGASGSWIPNVLLFVLLAAGLVLIAYLIARLRVPRAKRKKTRIILGEEVAADGAARELAEAGLAAARAGDFRTAVRKLYVSLLYELAERNLIELDDSATNHEYLRRVSSVSRLAAPMRYLTDRFDYVWYGMFPSSPEDFAAYLARYEEAMQGARSLNERTAGAG